MTLVTKLYCLLIKLKKKIKKTIVYSTAKNVAKSNLVYSIIKLKFDNQHTALAPL